MNPGAVGSLDLCQSLMRAGQLAKEPRVALPVGG